MKKLMILLIVIPNIFCLAAPHLNQSELNESIKIELGKSLQKMRAEINNSLKNSFSTEMKSRGLINKSEIKYISYVLASNKGVGRSSFGHSYIRLSKGDKPGQDDITYEFVADVSDKNLSYMKAIGFGENYGIRIDKAPYSKARDFHVLEENRDMTSFILDLDNDQKNKIITKLNELILTGTEKKYAFFINNCADIVTDVLNAGLKKKITGFSSVTPILIPDVLEELNLIKDEVIDERRTKLISNAVEEKFSKIAFPQNSKFTFRLKELLSSESLNDRIRGYYQLNQLTKDMNKMDMIRVISMVFNMSKFEHRQLRFYLPELFKTRDSQVKEFLSFKTKLPSKAKINGYKFKTKGDEVKLIVKLQTPKEKYEMEYDVNHLKFSQGRIISKSTEQIIFYDLGEDLIKSRYFHPGTKVFIDIKKEEKDYYLSSYMFTEKERFRKKIKTAFNREDEIGYKNKDLNDQLENRGLGVCMSHSELSQKLELFGIFTPNEKRLSDEKNLEIIKMVYQDQIVVIPGFKNTKELTSSIPVKMLAKVMQTNQQLKYNATESVFSSFSKTNIDHKNLYILKNLIHLGINPIISFKKSRYIAHSVLVTDIKEIKGKFRLSVIDPNMTYQRDIYTVDPKTGKVKTNFHGDNVEIFIPYIPINKYYNLSYLRSHESIQDMLLKSYKAFGTTSISLKHLLR